MSGRIPGGVRALAVVSFFNDFASEMVYPLLPAFVSRLGGGAIALGALDGAADLTSALVKWWSGRLSDRPGWRAPLIFGGYLLAVLIRPVMSLSAAAWQVVGLRVVDRVGKGLRTPPRDAFIADITTPGSRGAAYGFHRAADHLGAVIGALAAWLLLSGGMTVPAVIRWSVVPGLVALAVLAALLRRSHQSPERSLASRAPSPAPGNITEDATGRVYWAPVIALAALTLARIPEALLLLRLQDLGIAVAAIPLLWGALHVVRSAASYPGGSLADRFGSRRLVAGGALLAAAVMAGLALARSPGVGAAIFLVFGLVAGLTESAERSLVAALSPRRTGRGFGGYHALTGLAALPAAVGFGVVYQRVGAAAALGISATALLAAIIGWLAVTRRTGGDLSDGASAR
ncbi:MAG TPA: MFS transporter [Gemmatimonadales bacterium]|nr:MFS transporter [Gemmatimonadales bacterium]